MYKKDIINLLFVTSFPVYGLGLYLSAAVSPTLGSVTCALPYIMIILFYAVDLLYRREFYWNINRNYWLILLFILSGVFSLFVAFNKGLPGLPFHLLILKTLLLLLPFHAFIIVYLYNKNREDVVRLTFKGFGLLLLFNIVGYYGLGLSNELHNIEGRINFPFLDGLYSVACLLAIMNLMLFYYLRKALSRPITSFYLTSYLVLNLFLFFYINSRMVTLVFLLVMILMFVNVLKTFTSVFLTSLFTLPLILNGSLLIYKILSLPIFTHILQRVNFVDIITFNGRSFLWDSGLNWLLHDQEGLIFGNGYKGHYFLGILGDVGVIFDLRYLYDVHLHSTTLEIVVSQGLVGLLLFILILYKAYRYYKKQYQEGSIEGAFFPLILFFIFVVHIDTYGYLDNSGGLILALLVSRISVNNRHIIVNAENPEIQVKENLAAYA